MSYSMWRVDLLLLMLLEPAAALRTVDRALSAACDDIIKVEKQRDDLLYLIKATVGIAEPIADCDCTDCATLRRALEVLK